MDKNSKNKVVRYGHSLVEWFNKNSFNIVLMLSVLHIGLAYIHTPHSGRADYLFRPA